MSVPMFRADAKAFADDLAAVLGAPFPAEDPACTWAEQAQSDGLTYIQRLDRIASMAAGEQHRAMAAQVNLAAAEPGPFCDAEQAEWSAYADIAMMLQVACRAADGRIDDARTLYERLPLTLQALRAGHITVSKALVMLQATADLDAPEAARVEKEALQKPGGTRSAFLRRVRRLVERIDPDVTVKKRQQARAERDVLTYQAEDGMNAINALLPAEDAARAWRAIDEHAKTLRTPGDQRTIGALRADALVDLLVNRPDGTPRVAWQVQVIVPVGTLLGTGEDDGHLPGYGPIPAEIARDIAADAEWRRLLTDPDTGHLLDAHPARYRPGAALERFIKLRDQHCRWPGCRQPARRCDLDHTIPHHKGGLTIRKNLACFCRRHHRTKQLPGWKITQGDHGELTFTTPTGRIYRTRPPNPDGTEHPVEEL